MLTLNYRYRIYPDASQQELLLEWMDICRTAYNYALGEIKDWCNSRRCLVDRCSLEKEYIIPSDTPFPNDINQINKLPKAKKEFPRLRKVSSQVLQQTIKQLHTAWKYFQARGFGFPRFKKFGQFKSLLFPQFKENPVTNIHVKLPKIGAIPINLHRPIPSGFVVKQIRVIRKADRWYASINIQCDVSVPPPAPHGYPIGVDIGLEKFLATSEGTLVKPPKFLSICDRQLKLLQRRLSRKQRRSKNYEKVRIKVARLHHKIDNTRKDFHFKQAHALCDEGDMIFIEDLDYRITAKGFLGKQMLDGGFGQFRAIVQYICWKRGKFFAVVDARGTSQECPNCGGEVKKALTVRVHRCPHCNYITDRDVASAQVIRNRGVDKVASLEVSSDACANRLISTVGQTGMETACADDLPGIEVTQSRQVSKSRKGKTRKTKK